MGKEKVSIVCILKRLERVETELSEIRKDITEYMKPSVNSSSHASNDFLEFTMDDLCEAFGRKHKSYAYRLRDSLMLHGVTTLSEFLSMSPGQLLNLDGIGATTLEYTNKALQKLGITW